MTIEALALATSFAAVAISILVLIQSSRYRKTALEQKLFDQRNSINTAFAEFQVRGPFATLLSIPDEELAEYAPKACLLNMQINLLNDIFQNRRSFAVEIVEAHENWARNILRPWINSDEHLRSTMQLIYKSRDIFHISFLRWLQALLSD